MPFRHLEPGRFDLDTLKLMQQAFDRVCAKLQMGEGDSRRLTLANEIIWLAAEGTREQLTEHAEAALVVTAPPRSNRATGLFTRGHWGAKQANTRPAVGTDQNSRSLTERGKPRLAPLPFGCDVRFTPESGPPVSVF